MDLLITQAALRGETVIIIDPKGDRDMRSLALRACRASGRPERFVSFHPAFTAQNFIDKRFERLQNAFFSLSVVLRALDGGDPVERCETDIIAAMDEQAGVLDRAADELGRLTEDHGVNAMPLYSKPRHYTIRITSPLGLRLLALVDRLDRLVGVIDCLWLNGVIDGRQRNTRIGAYRRGLFSLAGSIIARVGQINKRVHLPEKQPQPENGNAQSQDKGDTGAAIGTGDNDGEEEDGEASAAQIPLQEKA